MDVFDADDNIVGAGAAVLGGHVDFGDFGGLLVQGDCYFFAARIERFLKRGVAEAVECESCGRLLHLDDEVALGIGDGSVGGSFFSHRYERERITFGVHDDTLNLCRLCRYHKRQEQ